MSVLFVRAIAVAEGVLYSGKRVFEQIFAEVRVPLESVIFNKGENRTERFVSAKSRFYFIRKMRVISFFLQEDQ